jgi:hypothetical protein
LSLQTAASAPFADAELSFLRGARAAREPIRGPMSFGKAAATVMSEGEPLPIEDPRQPSCGGGL